MCRGGVALPRLIFVFFVGDMSPSSMPPSKSKPSTPSGDGPMKLGEARFVGVEGSARAEAVERGLAFKLLHPKKDAGLDRAERLEVRVVRLGGRVDGPRRLLGEFLSFVEVHEALDRRRRGTAVADHAQGALVGERAELRAGRDLIKMRRPGAVRVAADRRALHVDDLRRAVDVVDVHICATVDAVGSSKLRPRSDKKTQVG